MIYIGNPKTRIIKHQTELIRSFEEFLQNGSYVLGSGVASFEKAFAEYIGVRHCIGVANGTDALELALCSLGIGAGDIVATAANAGGYSYTAIQAVRATCQFLEVDADTGCVSLQAVNNALREGPKAIIITHLYGRIAPDTVAIADLCKKCGIVLIEDCAQAHGALLKGGRAGSYGDASCFSFYPTKNLGALGDGGAVCAKSDVVSERCQKLRQYGWDRKYQISLSGGRNSRLDELQARILLVMMKDLDAENLQRIVIADRYHNAIRHPLIRLPSPPAEAGGHVYHLFVIQVLQKRDELLEHLKTANILADIHYPTPDYAQPSVRPDYRDLSLTITDRLAEMSLTLPCYPGLDTTTQDIIIEAVNAWKPI